MRIFSDNREWDIGQVFGDRWEIGRGFGGIIRLNNQKFDTSMNYEPILMDRTVVSSR